MRRWACAVLLYVFGSVVAGAEEWVAAQDVGVPEAFFSRAGATLTADEIRVGDLLVSNRDINVRPGPADWSRVLTVLPAGTLIAVLETAELAAGNWSQVWLRFSIATNVTAAPAPPVLLPIAPQKPGQPPQIAPSPQQPPPPEPPMVTPTVQLPPETTAPQLELPSGPIRDVVVQCLAAGSDTPRELYVCSGSLFTPELLRSCVLGGECEFGLPAATLGDTLAAAGLGWDTPLSLPSIDLDQNQIAVCLGAEDPGCMAEVALSIQRPDAECRWYELDPDALAQCVIGALPEPIRGIATCALGASGGDILACFPQLGGDLAKINEAYRCVRSASTDNSLAIASCFFTLLPTDYARLLTCIGELDTGDVRFECVGGIPFLRPAVAFLGCVESVSGAADLLLRCSGHVGLSLPEAARVCLANASDPASCMQIPPEVRECLATERGFQACVLETVPDLAELVRVAQCVMAGRDLADLVVACLPLDPSITRPISCALQQNDTSGLLACAAASLLNEEGQRVLSCALASESLLELAVCLTGIELNREWAIAVRCIGQSGGEPFAAAGCTVGRLTMNELGKCRNGIGTDDGCFGPNNTLIREVDRLAEAIGLGSPMADTVRALGSGVMGVIDAVEAAAKAAETCGNDVARCGPAVREACEELGVACPFNWADAIPDVEIKVPQIPCESFCETILGPIFLGI